MSQTEGFLKPDEIPKITEEPTDIESVLFFSNHIAAPCETSKGNIRDFWIRLAQEALEKNVIKEPKAREILENVIKQYSV